MKMEGKSPRVRLNNLVMDCKDAGVLAKFYSRLLGYEWTHPHANGWAAITGPDGFVIAFQEVAEYAPPVWPWEAGKQGQMIHFDLYVDDLMTGVRYAESLGARLAEPQFFKTSRTMFDPEGHPFCIDTDEPEE
jgi:hypothetical protein